MGVIRITVKPYVRADFKCGTGTGMGKADKTRTTKLPGWVNKSTLCASLGITRKGFDKWGVEPVGKIGRESFFLFADVLNNRLNHTAQQRNSETGLLGRTFEELMADPNLDYIQRAELMKVEKVALENQRMKLQNAVLEGRSLPAWGVTQVLAKILSRAGEIFDGMPLKIKRKHPNLDKRIIQLIQAEVVKAQNEVARLDDYIEEIIDEVVAEAEERIR